jgi:hypothetical protein
VEKGKKSEGSTGLDGQLGGGIQSTVQKLNVLRLSTFTSAVIDADIVDAVHVKNLEFVRPRNRIRTLHAYMA